MVLMISSGNLENYSNFIVSKNYLILFNKRLFGVDINYLNS
jgi:hypothetical protein